MRAFVVGLLIAFAGCSTSATSIDRLADEYVLLAFALDRHDPGFLDAYLGAAAPTVPELSLEAILERTASALAKLGELESPRRPFLMQQLEALARRARGLSGRELGFDEELRESYGVTPPPRRTEAEARAVIEAVSFQPGPPIAPDRLDEHVRESLAECRRRSESVMELPEEETVELRYVRGQAWSAFHGYLGDFRSVVSINRDVQWTEAQLLEAVCHESYPGHHAVAVLTEARLVRERGLREHAVVTHPSPRAFLMERIARAGFAKAFPEHPRPERVLAPFAVEGARRYVDGELDRVATVIWLEKNALMADGWTFLQFVDRYRSFVMAYSYRDGEDIFDDLLDEWMETSDAS